MEIRSLFGSLLEPNLTYHVSLDAPTIPFIFQPARGRRIPMAASKPLSGTSELSLADRILPIVSKRGYVGITRDEPVSMVVIAYDELMAALDELRSCSLTRVQLAHAGLLPRALHRLAGGGPSDGTVIITDEDGPGRLR